MRVLIGCEESGVVRDAFLLHGHDAWSCDLLPTRHVGPHLQCDVMEAVEYGWDLIILHPECTCMSLSGNGTYGTGKPDHHKRIAALDWTERLWNLARQNAGMVALEQPASVLCQRLGKRTQEIHPWEFGHKEQKTTWLWLHNLPLLKPANNVYDEMMKLPKKERCRVWYMPKSKTRARDRSETYSGIAAAFAAQWGMPQQ